MNIISWSTPIVFLASPPRNSANPDTAEPSIFSTPTVDARNEAGTTSNADGAWFAMMNPANTPNAIPARGVPASVPLEPNM